MVEILRLLIVLWGLSITVRAANLYFYEQGDSPVKEYTGATNNFVLSHRPRIVEFYSPYCPACRRFSPEYKELAKAVTDQYSQAEFYGVSCAAHDDVCRDFEGKCYVWWMILRSPLLTAVYSQNVPCLVCLSCRKLA